MFSWFTSIADNIADLYLGLVVFFQTIPFALGYLFIESNLKLIAFVFNLLPALSFIDFSIFDLMNDNLPEQYNIPQVISFLFKHLGLNAALYITMTVVLMKFILRRMPIVGRIFR